MKTRLQPILVPFGDPKSLSWTSLPALLVINMMKYFSIVKNRWLHFLQCNHSKLLTDTGTDTDHDNLNVTLLNMVRRAFGVSLPR